MGGVGEMGGVAVGRLMDLGFVMIGAMGTARVGGPGDVGPGESSCSGWHLPTGERFGGVS